MSDIVDRLRALVVMDEVQSDNPLGRDAADEIERLRADVASLTAQCESYRESFAGTVKVNDNLCAENAKLREALTMIEGAYFKGAVTLAVDGKWQEICTELQKIARAALKDTQP